MSLNVCVVLAARKKPSYKKQIYTITTCFTNKAEKLKIELAVGMHWEQMEKAPAQQMTIKTKLRERNARRPWHYKLK
jgi:hypothetical protein